MIAGTFDGQNMCVVGGTADMGLAVARWVAAGGARVIIAGRSAERAAGIAAGIGPAVTGRALDITDAGAVERYFVGIGPIDHLVVTAAQVRGGPFQQAPRRWQGQAPSAIAQHAGPAARREMLLPRWCRTLMLAGALVGMSAAGASGSRAADAVTEWTLEADRLGQGGANWRTLAIMHQAMHDAANAVQPRYARWSPPVPGEPPAAGAMLEAALAGAAAQVLVDLHPAQQAEIGRLFQSAIRRLPGGTAVQTGLTLGQTIGNAAVARRAGDGYERVHAFAGSEEPGRWRPVPPALATSNTTAAVPFLFASRKWEGALPPPAPGSAILLRDVAEVRRLGVLHGSSRTAAQTYAATYWAYQSSQRGFVRLAVSLLDRKPLPGGLLDHARAMSQLATAMADSAIMTWSEKERFAYWRPITVIRNNGAGIVADLGWEPLIETPPHPEYPSGHACDCYTGAGVLAGVFGQGMTPVTYVAQSGMPQAEVAAIGMGQHAQVGNLAPVEREFATFRDAAQECALARIWAGAHFRSANAESERLGHEITTRALAAVPAMSATTRPATPRPRAGGFSTPATAGAAR